MSVSASVGNASTFGLSGTLTTSAQLDYNSAAVGFDRLDWATAFDLDGDGLADVLDQGALLPTPADLAIGFASSLQYALSGSVTNLSVQAGPVTISGNALFALSRSTVDVDTDGNGTADLLGATHRPAGAVGAGRHDRSGDRRCDAYLARQPGAGEGDAFGSGGDGTLHGAEDGRRVGGRIGRQRLDLRAERTLTISSLDYNSAAVGFDRLDWATAFDLDGDGTADVLDPGALLPTPADLAIGFASSLQYALSGSVTEPVGSGRPGDDQRQCAVCAEPVDGGCGHRRQRHGPDLLGADALDQLALSVQAGTTVAVTGVATLTLQGNLALARETPSGRGDGTLHGAEDGRRVGERIGRQRLDLRAERHADDQLRWCWTTTVRRWALIPAGLGHGVRSGR